MSRSWGAAYVAGFRCSVQRGVLDGVLEALPHRATNRLPRNVAFPIGSGTARAKDERRRDRGLDQPDASHAFLVLLDHDMS